MIDHKSDCAVHNEPAYPAGKCDCGVDLDELERLHQEAAQTQDNQNDKRPAMAD
jgi:hypothetical protein